MDSHGSTLEGIFDQLAADTGSIVTVCDNNVDSREFCSNDVLVRYTPCNRHSKDAGRDILSITVYGSASLEFHRSEHDAGSSYMVDLRIDAASIDEQLMRISAAGPEFDQLVENFRKHKLDNASYFKEVLHASEYADIKPLIYSIAGFTDNVCL